MSTNGVHQVQPASHRPSLCPPVFFCGADLSLIEVFPMCLLKGNHHQDICKVSGLWSTHRNLAKGNPVALSLLGGWKDGVFALRAAGGVSRVLAPPEMKPSSFSSYLRWELFHWFPPTKGMKNRCTYRKTSFICPCSDDSSDGNVFLEWCVFLNK